MKYSRSSVRIRLSADGAGEILSKSRIWSWTWLVPNTGNNVFNWSSFKESPEKNHLNGLSRKKRQLLLICGSTNKYLPVVNDVVNEFDPCDWVEAVLEPDEPVDRLI